MEKIIVVVGPTGIGKTKLGIMLAKALNGEVINADSTQVYKGLDIATAKVSKEEQDGIPHHLLDIVDVTDTYTVCNYQKDCRLAIDDIRKRHKRPIIVGGTGLYIKAALYNYKFIEEGTTSIDDTETTPDLFNKLLIKDPHTTIHPNNRKRIIRALMILKDMKKRDESPSILLYDSLFIGLTTNRDTLYNLIDTRVDKMINNGLLHEAKCLYDSKIRTKAIMTPIGYKELFPYFSGEYSLNECINKIKQNSRHYAKRQYTWNNHQFNVKWFEVNPDEIDITYNEILTYIRTNN